MQPNRWSRRRFLRWSAALPFSAAAIPPDEELVPFDDYSPEFRTEAQGSHPRVKAFDLRRLTSWTTPSEEFFAFHQTETVNAEARAWRLHVAGLVERPAAFSLDDLTRRVDRRDVPSTIECSGNSGDPRIMNGLVSNATWTGVSLAALLKECGIRPEAREVVFLGMDSEPDRKWEAGNAEFSSPHGWSIFVQDALAPEALVALAMNGKPLPAEHGFPLRLILPGWYGMAQVKWLTRVEVIDRRYEGRHMARNYQSLRAVKTPDGTLWLDTSISRNNLKSVIARVTRRRAGERFQYKIAGAAWGGPARVESVEVQIDGGLWRPVRIDYRNGDYAWLLWSLEWKDAVPGRHTLVSRAINGRGDVQPTREELRARLASNREDYSQWPRRVALGGA
ncbi:MAG TPA: molybdopterin-dependent oxidoreductase [Bryobacterales bacterium]|nr:molybdopterin-dependent oxidoreductase [Bryobacterales bacterium]